MPSRYKVKINKRCLKDIENIPKKDRQQIQERVLSLADNPRPDGCKKLKSKREALYRIRCGDYRIVYEIKDKILFVLVIDVGHRGSVYR